MFLVSKSEIVNLIICIAIIILEIITIINLSTARYARSKNVDNNNTQKDNKNNSSNKNDTQTQDNQCVSLEDDDKEYDEYIEHIKCNTYNVEINLVIYNVKKNTQDNIIKSKSLSVNEVYYDPNNKLSVHEYGDAYYATTLSELKDIICWMLAHQEIYR